jgi:subtilisin family serine protease
MADNRVIVRTTELSALQTLCLLPTTCTVVGPLDGSLKQVFLVTTPLDLTTFVNLLGGLTGFVDAEVDQLITLIGTQNLVPSPLPSGLLSDRTTVTYSGAIVWNAYANQPAASDVHLPEAQSTFKLFGAGVVADIDTGVDPNHPALQPVLLQGYDFTRNQPGGSEMADLSSSDFPTYPPPPCDATTCPSPAVVNQSSAAILDQSSAAILDTNTKYAAFGHGTMVMGVIHLVAPQAQLLPLKAFRSDGTGYLSDILRAIYYAVQNNAKVINMSFSLKAPAQSPDTELKKALDYASQLTLICAASAGNDGSQEPDASGQTVFPAALQTDVMSVASVSTTNPTTRSSFSNYGSTFVWVAAPGEAIITTYPFSTYSAGWGTSFSAPFVSGGAALLVNQQGNIAESGAAAAIANADPLDPSLGHGLLDLLKALQASSGGSTTPDFTMAAAPSSATITAGQPANFSISMAPVGSFKGTVTLSCTGAPSAATCVISPPAVTLDGTNPATAALTLTTTARALAPPFVRPPIASPRRLRPNVAPLLIWFALFALLWYGSRIPRRRPLVVHAVAFLAIALCAYACGGGYGTTQNSAVYSVALSPASVQGGGSSTGSVSLSGPAPSGGAVVSLSSSNTAVATVPSTVTVAAGATSASFTISTSAVTSSTTVTISASYGGATNTAAFTVTPTPAASGTPAGTYTITATGTSGNLTHATTVQVTVN